MKKISKALVTLLFCIAIVCTSLVSVFAASAPGQVKGLKATNVTYNSATLTWTKVSGASGYEVEKYSNKKWVSVDAKVKSNSLTVSSLTTGTTYKYRVRAYKSNIFGKKTYGKYSSTVSVKPVPAKVTNLKVSNIKTTSAKLTWTKVAGASGYYVQQYSSKKWKTIKTLNAKTASYTLTKLKLGTSYKYRVIAYRTVSKKKIQGAASATVTVKPAVSAPASLKSSSVTASSATLTWGKVAEATGYQIQQYKSNKWAAVKTVKGAATVSSAVSITPGTNFKFRVLAYKTSGKKTYYSAATKEVTVKYTVAKPTSLKAASVSATSAKLTWKAASGVAGYQIQQYADGKWKQIATSTTNSYTTSIIPATSYKFRVLSYVKVGNTTYASAASNEISVKYTIAAPSALQISSVSKESVSLSWKAASNAAGYMVYKLSGSTWQKVATVKTTTATISGLSAATTYDFKVCAYQTINSKSYSSAYTSTVSAKTAPTAPTLSSSAIKETAATLSWTASEGAAGYVVYKYDNNAWTEYKTLNATKLDLTGLTSNTTYKFCVAAYHTANGSAKTLSEKSAAVSFTTYYDTVENISCSSLVTSGETVYRIEWNAIADSTYEIETYNTIDDKWTSSGGTTPYHVMIPGTTDLGLTVNETSNCKVNVSWNAVNGASKYILQTRTGYTIPWNNVIETTSTSATLPLAASTKYQIRVVAFNATAKVRAVKGTLKTDYTTITNIPGSMSDTAIVTTSGLPAFNKNDKEVKTIYTLMALQAINNTKEETTIASYTKTDDLTSDIDKITYTTTNIFGKPVDYNFNSLLTLIEFLGAGDLSAELTEDFNEHASYTGFVRYGTYYYTESIENKTGATTFSKTITPYDTGAYLYEASDTASIDKKITDISYTSNSDGTTTMKLVLAKETATASNDTTPVHEGILQSFGGMASTDGMEDAKITVGASTVTLVINESGTLNSLVTESPYTIYTSFTMEEGKKLSLTMSGKSVSKYTFTR